MTGSLCLNILWIVCKFVVAEDELRRPILTKAMCGFLLQWQQAKEAK